MPQLGSTRLNLHCAQAEIGTERGVCQGKTAMLLTQLRQIFERSILLVEFAMPAADFHRAQLRVLKRLPGHEGCPVHDLIIPAHEFEIVLFGMPAQPGNKIPWTNSSGGRQIPQLSRKAKPAKVIIDIIVHGTVRDLAWPIAKAMIGGDAGIARQLRPTLAQELE